MLANQLDRRRLLQSALLMTAGTVIAAACGRDDDAAPDPVGRADGPPTAPGSGTPLVPAGVPPVTASEVDVNLGPGDLNRFLEDAMDEHREYFAAIRAQEGDNAARAEEAAVRAAYEQRIAAAQAGDPAARTLRVPLVTIWGAFTFSATSYEGPVLVKDPVSILFYWDGIADRIYEHSVSLLTCRPEKGDACLQAPRYQDEDDRQGLPGHPFRCHTSPQWVLMGNAGGPLQWVRDARGMMKDTDRCNRVGRDHIRVFSGGPHPVLGQWCVATPHRERFSFDPLPGKGGHIITSWNRAQRLYAGSWIETGLPGDRRGWDPSVFYWDWFDWGTGGVYQKVKFDGRGFLIGVDFADVGR